MSVETSSPVPGIVENVRIVAPSALAHRARWLLKTNKITDAELHFAATGELPDNEQES